MQLLLGFAKWHRFTSLIFGMARDLKQILSELGGRNGRAHGDSLRLAHSGDWYGVAKVADCLRRNANSSRNLSLAKELYEWLVERGRDEYLPFVCEIEHLLTPDLAYTEREVQLFLDNCGEFGTEMFGCLVKALQSNTQLFDRFKEQALQSYDFLFKRWDTEDTELSMWYKVLILDPRFKSKPSVYREALSDLEDEIDIYTNPYIVERYLDAAIGRNQRFMESWHLQSALDCLSGAKKLPSYYFYKGLCALCNAEYTLAFKSFCNNSNKRNQLAKAYCLVHGMGTPVNHVSAQEILRAYPDEPFAKYLLAVSLFRMSDHPKTIPTEVAELLHEAQQLGYTPAEHALCQMDLLCCFYAQDLNKLNAIIEEVQTHALKDKDPAAYGTCCYLLYLRCIQKLLILLDSGPGRTNQAAHRYMESSEYRESCKVINLKRSELTPLAAYSRSLMAYNVTQESQREQWVIGLHGFNQSPLLRKWGVQKALLSGLFSTSLEQEVELFHIFRNLGANDKEVLLWHAAIQMGEYVDNPDFRNTLVSGFLDLLTLDTRNPLHNLLRAWFYLEHLSDKKVGKVLQGILKETADVKDSLLVGLRNRIIQTGKLESSFPLNLDDYLISEVSEALLVHTTGYAFFDYNL